MDEITRIWPQWKVEEFIGKGAYGKVYKVRREEKDHISYAAVKVIEIPQDESEVKELLYAGMDYASVHAFFQDMIHGLDNEIKVMESLKTAENIVSIENYHFEERKDEIGWKVFIQMELMESLPRYIERMKKSGAELSTEEIVKIGINICSALECCEQEKIIHRDIKPDNIFRNKYGTYKLGDFGVARQMEKTKGTMSQKGTSMYMAPEIYLGSEYGHTVDIYSLGITMYKLLNAGRFPFYPLDRVIRPGDSDTAMVRRMRGDQMDAPCNADRRLAEIVLRACEFRPENRYQSASMMKWELEHWLSLEKYGNVERKPEAEAKRPDPQGEDPVRPEEPEEGTWRAFETKTGAEVKAQRQNAPEQNTPEQEIRKEQPQKSINAVKANENSNSAGKKRRRKRWIAAGGILLGVILLGVILGSRNESAEETVTVSEDEVPTIAGDEVTAQWEEMYHTVEEDITGGEINYMESSLEDITAYLKEKGWVFSAEYFDVYQAEIPEWAEEEDSRYLCCRYEMDVDNYDYPNVKTYTTLSIHDSNYSRLICLEKLSEPALEKK